MKTEKNILFAFLLNLAFSIFEFVGGIFTGSVAILSDSIHDIGDAFSIGVSFFLEKKSKKQPDAKHTYGYARYSVIGSVITTLVLLVGSVIVTYNAVIRIINPSDINYDGMIIFAVVGVCVNFFAALLTREGDSLNQKAVNLHMLEDVLGWIIVLIGAIVMRFTDFAILDPIMSIGLAIFIFVNAFRNLKEATDLFLEKTPRDVDVNELKEQINSIEGVIDTHHIHVWSMDGISNYATMHIVTNENPQSLKQKVRAKLLQYGICHVTLELESEEDRCHEDHCHVEFASHGHHHHHHHGHKHKHKHEHNHNHEHNHEHEHK
ncbi:MAG: cation transporter [Clostridia bacterium]|nr:cation transporter [Clostridia bacterium]